MSVLVNSTSVASPTAHVDCLGSVSRSPIPGPWINVRCHVHHIPNIGSVLHSPTLDLVMRSRRQRKIRRASITSPSARQDAGCRLLELDSLELVRRRTGTHRNISSPFLHITSPRLQASRSQNADDSAYPSPPCRCILRHDFPRGAAARLTAGVSRVDLPQPPNHRARDVRCSATTALGGGATHNNALW